VAWLDPPGDLDLEPGTEVVVTGHVRRRFFRAGGSTQSRTEVVADQVVKARARAKARRAVEEALATVDARPGA
jgi:single-strand DNA-binding protein